MEQQFGRVSDEAENILKRLMQLDKKACLRMRTNFPAHGRWYVCFGSVVGTTGGGGFYTLGGWYDGSTPELALRGAWEEVLKMSRSREHFFLIYDCEPKENIPGKGKQVWVRWNEASKKWEDVVASDEMLAAHNIPRDRIRSFEEHRYFQTY